MPPKVSSTSRAPLGAISTNSIVPPPASDPSSKPQPTKKRKAEPEPARVYDIDDDECQDVNITCQAVRAKIRRFLDSGEMKVGEFQKAIGASSSTYNNFMKQNGTNNGSGSTVYGNAFAFFKLRELNKVKPMKKKKIEGEAKVTDTNFDGIVLDGEEDNEAEVYDSCDEIRKKIRAYLAKTGMTKAAFSREIGKMFNPPKPSVSGLAAFMGKSGPVSGNTTAAFYGSYVFFEKLRIKEGKPKSQHRLGMEDAWDGCEPFGSKKAGMDTKTLLDRVQYIVHVGSGNIYHDEFGKPTMGR